MEIKKGEQTDIATLYLNVPHFLNSINNLFLDFGNLLDHLLNLNLWHFSNHFSNLGDVDHLCCSKHDVISMQQITQPTNLTW